MTEDRDKLAREAARAGLTTLLQQYPTLFSDARAAAERWRDGIPRHLHMYDEPAHTFRASEEA